MKVKHAILIGIALLLAHPFAMQAQIPGTLSYQAFLSDSSGVPKADGPYTLTFGLYDVETGSSPLWTETKDLDVEQGLFYTHLGDKTAFPASLRFDQPYWLGIQVGGEAELSPRIPLTSVGYSFHALRADSAAYVLSATGETIDGHSLDAADGDPTDVVYVDTAGYVGIGTTNPEDVFTIAKTIDGMYGPETETLTLIPGSTERGNPASIVTSFEHVRFITPAKISVNGSGATDVSITTKNTNVLDKLVVGSSGSISGPVGSAYFQGNVNIQGDVNITGTLTNPSDIRWKQNITSINGALTKVRGLRGVFFEWNRDTYPEKHFREGKQIGLIAQEVEEVLPELVRTDKDGYKAVEYQKITAVLVEAIREQQQEIEALKAAVAALQAQSDVALQELVHE